MTEPLPPVPPAPTTLSTRRNHRRFAIVAGAVAVVLVGGGVGAAVALAGGSSVSGTGTPAAAPATSSPTSGPSGATGSASAHRAAAHRIVGVITAENGDTWTVRTRAGATVTVTIGSTTKFGTEKAPAQRTQFPVGKAVVVTGPQHDGSVTARRVAAPPLRSTTPPRPTPSSTPS